MLTSSFSRLPYFTPGGGVSTALGKPVEILNLDPQLNFRPQRNGKTRTGRQQSLERLGGGFLNIVNVTGTAGSATAGFAPGFVVGAF
jgi:hypothetical protein